LNPEIEDESEEIRVQIIQIQNHLEAPRSWTNHWSKIRDLDPWYCHSSMVIAVDPRHIGGAMRRFSIHGLVSSSRPFFRL